MGAVKIVVPVIQYTPDTSRVEIVRALRVLTGISLKDAIDMLNHGGVAVMMDSIDEKVGDYKLHLSFLKRQGCQIQDNDLELKTKIKEAIQIAMDAEKYDVAQSLIDAIKIL